MDPYTFEDALTGSSISCDYPGLEALMVKGGGARGECPSLFFPGCSLINYGLPLVSSVFDLLKNAGTVDGISLLCCGKILSYEPNGEVLRATFEQQLIEQLLVAKTKRIVAACPNCVKALRAAFEKDSRCADIEIVALPQVFADLGYRLDPESVRAMVENDLKSWDGYAEALANATQPLRLAPHDSCPDRDTGEFAAGLRTLMGDDLVAEMEHNRKRSMCCGSLVRAQGKFEAAKKQSLRRGEEAQAAQAAGIITACMSCTYLLSVQQANVPVYHYLEFLFSWRINWPYVDQYMKLRFLFDETLGVQEKSDGRNFVGIGSSEGGRDAATAVGAEEHDDVQ